MVKIQDKSTLGRASPPPPEIFSKYNKLHSHLRVRGVI